MGNKQSDASKASRPTSAPTKSTKQSEDLSPTTGSWAGSTHISSSLAETDAKPVNDLGRDMASKPTADNPPQTSVHGTKAVSKQSKGLQRAKSALPPSLFFHKEMAPVPRSKSVPVSGHRRADINLDDDVLQEASRLQSSLKGELTERNQHTALSDADIEVFFKKCESYSYGSQKLSGTPGQERSRTGVLPSHIGVSCIKGLKGLGDSSPNQDNWGYCKFFGYEFQSVLDGHGPQGHQISFRGIRTLPYFISKSCHFPLNMKEAIIEGFIECHEDMVRYSVEQDFDIQVSGCACVLVIRKDRTLWISHAGDSRVVVGNISSGDITAETVDHKPTDLEERKRLESRGSEIQTFSFDGNVRISRVFVKGADFPGLCMSRSLGDQCVKAHGVIPTPDVSTYVAQAKDTFVVLASDGVWEFVPSKLVCSSLSKKLPIEGKEKCARN